ncbi:c6 zinc finger domain-containing protein [Diaporthe sp. PMI_573]|nr:c6 zinc finger domain-containing protein [Diaporthaceae sp. PMI_573]
MPSPSTGVAGSPANPTSPLNRKKRTFAACSRCHSQKTKCTGKQPCQSCVRSGKSAECIFPVRARKIVVLESYIQKLQAENAELRRNNCTSGTTRLGTPSSNQAVNASSSEGTVNRPGTTEHLAADESEDGTDANTATPLLEQRVMAQDKSVSLGAFYVGGAACTAFSTRLGACVRGSLANMAETSYTVPVYKHPTFSRRLEPQYTLPSRAYANMLIQVVMRFVGSDYHLIRRKSYLKSIDFIYDDHQQTDSLCLCRFFALLALGELWLKKTGAIVDGEKTVPGTSLFLQAVSLFQERFEEPSIEYIETLLALCFYCFALNRTSTAFVYAGLALRLSQTMGLHRNIAYEANVSGAEVENRRRVWWTVYIFDGLISSRLGHPMISDGYIDAPFPSQDNLPAADKDDFFDPMQLIANIRLCRITGSILSLIYGGPSPRDAGNFIRNVHTILNQLKEVDAELPIELKLDHTRFPAYGSRSVASLRLHFNQNLILTTRPVLLHILNHNLRRLRSDPSATVEVKQLSPMTIALSEACIYAARASANILEQLWISGNISTFGYFDAHYTFSTTVVLMISRALRPNTEDDDAIALGLTLLHSMVEDGNIPARELIDRISALQGDFEILRSSEGAEEGLMAESTTGFITSTGTFAANINRNRPRSLSQSRQASSSIPTPPRLDSTVDSTGQPTVATAPLDAPLIQNFLENCAQEWSPQDFEFLNQGNNVWESAWDSFDLHRNDDSVGF